MPQKPNEPRREQLLDELEAIVLDEGFEHLRVGGLAQRLHCSRSTLYKLASSKELLVARVFERYANRAVTDAASQADTLRDPIEKIMRYSDVIDGYQSMGSDRFWRDVAAHPVVSASLSEKRAKGYHYVVEYLKEGIATGIFREMNAAWVGHLIWLCAWETRKPDVLARLGVDRVEANHELMTLLVFGMRPISES